MKFVIQRVTEASVEVDEKIIGEIANGYLVLIGVGQEDTTAEADRLIKKMINLRIFSDENGKKSVFKRRQWRASARLSVYSLC